MLNLKINYSLRAPSLPLQKVPTVLSSFVVPISPLCRGVFLRRGIGPAQNVVALSVFQVEFSARVTLFTFTPCFIGLYYLADGGVQLVHALNIRCSFLLQISTKY